MSSQVVRVQGFTKGSLSSIGNEAERGNVNHRNPDIDPDRKYLNMAFKETDHGFYGEWCDIKTALNVQGKETKNGIAFEGMVITADKTFYEERFGWEQGKRMSPDMVKYFQESYEWAVKQIGYRGTDKNIISAVVHADETAPHLQLYYLPVTEKWQEKVYAKGEDGKVLRSERGTPIQAKDENGKTMYKQVEDLNSPKLARSEFWRVRGGQNSYSLMQDSYHEQVGSKYGLERGEVGSNANHRTKAQWEHEQLNAEKERLTAEVQPYRELNAGTAEVEAKGKTVLPGVVAVKKKDLATLKEQAKAYTVNRDEIESVRQRSAAVTEREQRADRRERTLENRQNEVEAMYQRQLNINRVLQLTERDCVELKKRNATLEQENAILKEQVAHYEQTAREAYQSLTNTIKAVGMLKYDNGAYKANLTEQQGRLVDAIANYGTTWAKRDGYPELAQDMKDHVGISRGIESEVRALEPRHSYDRGR